MGAAEITVFLNHLANADRVSASTQNHALSALLYRHVLEVEWPWLDGLVRAKTGSLQHRKLAAGRPATAPRRQQRTS